MIDGWMGFKREVPQILQGERAECGLACLTMVAAYHGYDVDLSTMRQRIPFSAFGATLRELVESAGRLRLTARAIKAPLSALAKLALPLVLHWDFNHFVVLVACRRDGSYVIHDPAAGRRILPSEEVSAHYTGVSVELSPASDFTKTHERSTLSFSRLLRGSIRGRAAIWHGVALATIAQLLALSVPLSGRVLIDTVIPAGDGSMIDLLGIGLLFVGIVLLVAHLARGLTFVYLGTAIHNHLARGLFRHLVELPLDFFQRRQIADLVSHFDSLRVIQRILGGSFVEAIVDGGAATLSLGVVLVFSPPLFLLAIGCMSTYGALRWYLQPRFLRLNEEQMVRGAVVQTSFIETMRGIETIKAHNGQYVRDTAWSSLLAAWFNATGRLQAQQALTSAAAATAQVATFGACLWYGSKQAIDAKVTLGALLASLSLIQVFSVRYVGLVDKLVDFNMLRIHRERLSDIYAISRETAMESEGLLCPHDVKGEIELVNLSFRYGADQDWVLRNLNLKVPAGEFLAIAGQSGEGKTTLLRILLGLLEPQEGAVLLDGVDLKTIGKQRYRDFVGVVLQNDTLFSGSLQDNISSFDPEPDTDLVETSARMAGIHDSISRLPMGYRTLVGDMGSVLSGGQQQRVFLARALYRKPRLLFLDEATSHLDLAKEKEINAEISKIGTTRIVIAHRLETLAAASRVVHLIRGKLVEDLTQGETIPAVQP